MGYRSRTITHGMPGLTIQCSGSPNPTLSFLNSERAVRIVLPATSKWGTPYNWHLDTSKCQTLQFMPGGSFNLSQSLGLYRSSFSSGSTGLHCQLRPGERNGWSMNRHYLNKEGDPDLEVIVVGDSGTENLCRNAASAELDKDLWPTLRSTPLVIRLILRLVKYTPFLGNWLWNIAVVWALRVQLLMIFHPHSFYVWCGSIPITRLWDWNLWVELPPTWAQEAEWRSAEIMAIVVTRLCWSIGSSVLGMKDTYEEYYRPRNLPGDLSSPDPSEEPVSCRQER